MRGSAARSSSGAFPFILLGVVDGIDVGHRSLTLAGRQMRVADYVGLDGVRKGARLVVTGMREGTASERAVVVGLVPVGPLASCATSPAAASEGRTLLPLLVTLLIELAPDIESLDCRLLPADRRYAVSVTIPGSPGTEVLLPRRMLERADADPAARGAAGLLLSAAARFLQAKRPASDRRRAARAIKLASVVWSRAGRRCDRCESALATDDPVVVEGHVPRHLACPPAR